MVLANSFESSDSTAESEDVLLEDGIIVLEATMVDSDVVEDELEMDGIESISRMILVAAKTSCAFPQ